MASSSRCAPKKIKQGTVYEIAEAIDLAYVSNRDFRMMFLRASRYDHQAAALQIIKYLELKRLLFGQEKLTRKITLADLNDDDKDYLESGIAQISTKRDRSGRGILLLFPSLRKRDYEVEAVLRARYYVIMSMLEEHQMNGIVLIYFGALPSKLNQEYTSNSGLLWNLPIFYAGIHCCFDELSTYLLHRVVILRLPFTLRPRTRVYYGSCTECLYKLSSFGIPKEAILPDSHEPSLSHHLEWYRQRQKMELTYATDAEIESLSSTGTGTIVIRPVDVLFGPAGRMHEGNITMRNLVIAMLDEYKDSTK